MRYLTRIRGVSAVVVAGLALWSVAALADLAAEKPEPFKTGKVKLALVAYLSGGDFFQAYEAGAARQAKALGVDLQIFEGRQKPDEQREQIRQAINLGVQGIIVDGGKVEAVNDVVQEAIDKGIKIVAGNIYLKNPGVTLVDQDFVKQADQVLDQVEKDNGDKFKAGYVYVEGFPALDLQHDVLAGSISVGEQELIFTFGGDSTQVHHALAVGRKLNRARHVARDLPRHSAQGRHRI